MILGEPIPVTITDGKKPDFVKSGDRCDIFTKGAWHVGNLVRDWTWHSRITAIKLLADHPYYARNKQMTETPVTLEALDAAAKYAGHTTPNNAARSVLKNPQKGCSLYALARMIIKHEPELIAESFDARTDREYRVLYDENFNGGLCEYRCLIKQHIEDAKP
jgi:hypothetical protein